LIHFDIYCIVMGAAKSRSCAPDKAQVCCTGRADKESVSDMEPQSTPTAAAAGGAAAAAPQSESSTASPATTGPNGAVVERQPSKVVGEVYHRSSGM
jgi:hypothetical protein